MKRKISRRDSLKIGLGLGIAACTPSTLAETAMQSKPDASAAKVFSKDSESNGVEQWDRVHGGEGTVAAKRFPFSQAAHPANFITYDIPPGIDGRLDDDS